MDAEENAPPPSRVVAFAQAEYVSSNASAFEALRKMHSRNEGIIFDNIDGDIRLMVRPVFEDESSVGAEDVEFQIAVLNEDDDEALTKALEREFDGAFDMDDEETFIVDSVDVTKMSELNPEHPDVEKFRKIVNKVHGWRLCHCGLGFIKEQDDAFCMRCSLTCSDKEREANGDSDNDCVVCMEPSGTRFSREMKCCKKRTHDRCLKRWLSTSNTCPHCRHPVDNRVEVIIDLID